MNIQEMMNAAQPPVVYSREGKDCYYDPYRQKFAEATPEEIVMDKNTYSLLENYMLACMKDSAHDKDHIYRVLYNALDIAKTESHVNGDVLIAACLLHDIGRITQAKDPKISHAQAGAKMAYDFLIEHNFEKEFALHVESCIMTHSYRKKNPPQTLEAKILFDADKLDVTGAIGIARTLMYKGGACEPMYSLRPDGTVSDGTEDQEPSFFQEYKFKLENIYSRFYTQRARDIALQRQETAAWFYNKLYNEVTASYENGEKILEEKLL